MWTPLSYDLIRPLVSQPVLSKVLWLYFNQHTISLQKSKALCLGQNSLSQLQLSELDLWPWILIFLPKMTSNGEQPIYLWNVEFIVNSVNGKKLNQVWSDPQLVADVTIRSLTIRIILCYGEEKNCLISNFLVISFINFPWNSFPLSTYSSTHPFYVVGSEKQGLLFCWICLS